MVWFAIIAGAIGFCSVYYTGVKIPIGYLPYISLGALAGIDSLIGGIRASQKGDFRGIIFVSGFIVNTLLAAFLVYLGELLEQPLQLAAVVALGGRIFVNLSIIRREWLEKRLSAINTADTAQAETSVTLPVNQVS